MLFAAILVASIVVAATIYISRRLKHMSNVLDALTAQVEKNTAVEASAIALIQGLAAQIAANANDPAAIAALAAQLAGSADALAAAVVSNTPAAPVVP